MSDGILVIKFGGTSVGTPRRVRRAAARIAAQVARGRRVVAVVSAAGHTTDHLVARLAAVRGAGALTATRETDRVLATGEDLSAALLAAALESRGVPARSLRGGEAGVLAAGPPGAGRIRRIDAERLHALLARGIVPVVSGFQGADDAGETLTLGRGASDTSAVAVAAALGAECHIVTDVAAVYDRDPRRDTGARAFRTLSHHQLLALAADGAQVVHAEAAGLALRHDVPLRVYHHRAPLAGESGTAVGGPPAALEGAA